MNSHCVQINEWKAINFVFARNDRTKELFKIIDRYESTAAAAIFQGGNDGNIFRVEIDQTNDQSIHVQLATGVYGSGITIVNGQINGITCSGLQDDDILDLKYLPKHLKDLALWSGTLTHMDLSALPQGLVYLNLEGNNIRMIMVRDPPPSLEELNLNNNPLDVEGVTLKLPLPQALELRVTKRNSLNLGSGRWEGILHEGQGGEENYWLVIWSDFWSDTRLKVRCSSFAES